MSANHCAPGDLGRKTGIVTLQKQSQFVALRLLRRPRCGPVRRTAVRSGCASGLAMTNGHTLPSVEHGLAAAQA